MGKPLSMDLRSRALATVDEGMSCRVAAVRFGVAAATVIRWHDQRRRTGTYAAKPQGGDTRAIEQDRADVLSAREDWFNGQLDLDPARLVFIDETWTATNMTRSHGRCSRGERLRMGYPHGHRKTTTLVAGLRMTGMVAPMVLDGPINGDWFEAYVRKILVPDLGRGDVVIMDNLSSHKRASVREAIEAAGARLMFLPPYSPDFNPIEKAFARLRPCCAEPASAPCPGSGPLSANWLTCSSRRNAPTISDPVVMIQTDQNPL